MTVSLQENDLRTPVNVLTGFLGSGKTTILQRSISTPLLRGAAVLINEFGEIGLDHLLVQQIDENIVLLKSGCVCCSVRGDIRSALGDLYDRRASGAIQPFDRVVIETTGLADPVPVLSTLANDSVLNYHFRSANVVTTVDAVNIERQLENTDEAVRQICVADRLIITKTDLLDDDRRNNVRALVRRLNGAAPIVEAPLSEIDVSALFGADAFDPRTRLHEVEQWLSVHDGHHHHHGHDAPPAHLHRHDGIETASVEFAEPIDWSLFALWFSMVLHRHGDKILRIKGIIDVIGSETPVVVHGVQHLIHAPSHLPRWPDGPRRSKLVFITKDLDPRRISASIAIFQRLCGATTRGD